VEAAARHSVADVPKARVWLLSSGYLLFSCMGACDTKAEMKRKSTQLLSNGYGKGAAWEGLWGGTLWPREL
jgi:hypothetical protein